MSSSGAVVVVPTRQRAHVLPALVRALASQRDVAEYEIIIVDDASTDGTVDVLRDLARAEPKLKVERMERHAGPAAARNVGWRKARCELVAFTDDDCLPGPSWLSELIAAHERGLDVVQGKTIADSPRTDRDTYSNIVEISDFSSLYQTCNMSYRRELLDTLGGFDEAFGYSRGGAPNGEDADLGWRAAAFGARCGFAPDAIVVHPVVPRSFQAALRARQRSFRMVYFVRRHPGFRTHAYHRYFFRQSHPYALVSLVAWLPLLIMLTPWYGLIGVLGLAGYGYFRWRIEPVPGRRRYQPLFIAGAWIIDCTEVIVMFVASIRWRTVFL
jgi:GT2 family glycosyltransferase